jgi:hypothetical protein
MREKKMSIKSTFDKEEIFFSVYLEDNTRFAARWMMNLRTISEWLIVPLIATK